MIATAVDYHEPATLDEACHLLDRYGEDGRILAGGTAVVLFMRQGLLAPSCLINIQPLTDLAQMAPTDDGVDVGALVTHSNAQRSPVLRGHYAALTDTFARVATPRIRNAGTVGGNLAHGDPHLDPPVTLLALDAAVTAVSSRGARRIALVDFFRDYYETALQPGEILTRIHIPVRPARSGLAFIKFLPRSQDDYATVDVAAWVRLDDSQRIVEARLALGSVGSIPFRASDAEALFKGEPLTEELAAEAGALAAEAADPEDDVRGSAAYKRELIKVLVPRALRQAVADALP
jgi:aerobic carbon-monoxide dehydrogenase medium subunit